MTNIIKPNEPAPITVQMSRDMAKGLASILGEYATRITMPELKEDMTDEQKTDVAKVFEERKKFSASIANSLWTEANK